MTQIITPKSFKESNLQECCGCSWIGAFSRRKMESRTKICKRKIWWHNLNFWTYICLKLNPPIAQSRNGPSTATHTSSQNISTIPLIALGSIFLPVISSHFYLSIQAPFTFTYFFRQAQISRLFSLFLIHSPNSHKSFFYITKHDLVDGTGFPIAHWSDFFKGWAFYVSYGRNRLILFCWVWIQGKIGLGMPGSQFVTKRIKCSRSSYPEKMLTELTLKSGEGEKKQTQKITFESQYPAVHKLIPNNMQEFIWEEAMGSDF